MKYGSVCSGIEAASAAWEPLGWEPVFFSEIDPFPRAVLAHHYPNVPCHGDFTTINRDSYAAIDVLVGGTPCQDFSLAGLRAGLDGGRGNLSLEFGRLLGRLRPQWFCWENVPGVFSSNNGEDFAGILGMFTGRSVSVPTDGWRNSGVLQGIGSAYSVAWRVLDAQYLGVPQRRRRVFVVGCLGADWRRAFSVLFESHSMSGDSPPRREKRKESATRFETSPSADNRDGSQVGMAIVGFAKYSQDHHPLLRAEGGDLGGGSESLIVTKEQSLFRMEAFGQYEDDGTASTMKMRDYKDATDLVVVKTSDTGSNGSNFNEDGVAYTLDTINGQAVVQPLAFNGQASHHQPMSVEEVSPALDTSKIVNVLQPALSSSSTLGVDDELNASEELMGALKASRHGSFVQFPYTAYGIDEECNAKEELFGSLLRGGEGGTRQTVVQIPESEVAKTLKARHDGSPDGEKGFDMVSVHFEDPTPINTQLGLRGENTSNSNREGLGIGNPGDPSFTLQAHHGHAVAHAFVRRLTPKECSRLQGFQDDFAKIPWKNKPAGECPDGPQYKTYGNSMAVPVMSWIGKRIQMVHEMIMKAQ